MKTTQKISLLQEIQSKRRHFTIGTATQPQFYLQFTNFTTILLGVCSFCCIFDTFQLVLRKFGVEKIDENLPSTNSTKSGTPHSFNKMSTHPYLQIIYRYRRNGRNSFSYLKEDLKDYAPILLDRCTVHVHYIIQQ